MREQDKSLAIVGAGFCGMAAAYCLAKNNFNVDVYYEDGGASASAVGLLHAFTGRRAQKSKEADLAITKTKELLKIASKHLDAPPYINGGIYRLALTKEMESDYKTASEQYPNDIRWVEKEEVQKKLPQCPSVNGIFIEGGLAVYAESYLQGLKKAAESYGAKFIHKKVLSLTELEGYKKIILAQGVGLIEERLAHLNFPLFKVKGQLLELKWPEGVPPLAYPISSNILAVMAPGNKSCLVGATYERNYSQALPDPETAAKDLLPKIAKLVPCLENTPILDCRSGFRVTSADRMPILRQIDEKTIVLTAMGSKGLLYHALYAERLALALKLKT